MLKIQEHGIITSPAITIKVKEEMYTRIQRMRKLGERS